MQGFQANQHANSEWRDALSLVRSAPHGVSPRDRWGGWLAEWQMNVNLTCNSPQVCGFQGAGASVCSCKPQSPFLSCRCRRRCALQVRPCAAACLPVCACTDALPRARRRPQRAMATAESDLEVRTMHVFISRALQKILKEAPKKLTALRTSCTSVLGACPRPAAAACARCEPAGRLLVPLNSTSPMLLWLLSMRRGAPEEWRRLLSTAAGGGRVAAGDAAAGDALGI